MSQSAVRRHSSYDGVNRQMELEAREIDKKQFLEDCKAQLCTAETYAKWLSRWLEEGGKVTHFYNYPFDRRDWLQPTLTTTTPIPTDYGARSLNLVILAGHATIPLDPTSEDDREGWEWGHTIVCLLKSVKTGKRAWTNQTYWVSSYSDIEDYLTPKAQEILRTQREVPDVKRYGLGSIDSFQDKSPDERNETVVARKRLHNPASVARAVETSPPGPVEEVAVEPTDYDLGRETVDELNKKLLLDGIDIKLPVAPEQLPQATVQAKQSHLPAYFLLGEALLITVAVIAALVIILL